MPPAWLLAMLFGAEEALEVGAVGVAIALYLYSQSSGKGRRRR
jgi:hypothetical protein